MSGVLTSPPGRGAASVRTFTGRYDHATRPMNRRIAAPELRATAAPARCCTATTRRVCIGLGLRRPPSETDASGLVNRRRGVGDNDIVEADEDRIQAYLVRLVPELGADMLKRPSRRR